MSFDRQIVQNYSKARASPARALLPHDTIARFSNAADRGQPFLFAEAEAILRDALDDRKARIIIRSGGAWREWDKVDGDTDYDPIIAELPESSIALDSIATFDQFTFIPVQKGSVALFVERMENHSAASQLAAFCLILKLALGSCESRHGNPDKLEAIKAFQRVANRMLKSRNIQEIFLQITDEAKCRLSADICGIMLKEKNWLVMQRCVGNLAAETATLRMRAGQGVGGRVLQTREPCSVEDYVESEIISRDFFNLARVERVRSALAVPLMSRNEVIGVLEVWRRKPSTFTPQHTSELETLAKLTSLAIETVRLGEERESASQRLELAHRELKKRYEIIERSAELQENLTSTLLSDGKLPHITLKGKEHLHTPVAIFDRQIDLLASNPDDAVNEDMLRALKAAISRRAASDMGLHHDAAGSVRFCFQSIMAASEHLGWVVFLNPKLDEAEAQLAMSQICVTAALHLMKERAAARALSDKLATLMWDLVEAPDHLRYLAVERAKELGIGFSGPFCIMVCQIEGLDKPNDRGVLSNGEVEVRRKAILDIPNRLHASQRSVSISGVQGDILGVVAAYSSPSQCKDLANAVLHQIAQCVPRCTARIGISRPASDPMSIPAAWKDARVALEVARKTGDKRVVMLGDGGVAGLLMSMRDGADFRAFVSHTLAKLQHEKPSQRDMLLKTLRAYFSTNCSQQAAADKLRTHQKTIAYRLDKIERMTGLDLASHEHRVLLYLALRMNDLMT